MAFLGFEIDSSQAKKAKANLDAMSAASEKADMAAASLKAASAGAGKGLADLSGGATKAAAALDKERMAATEAAGALNMERSIGRTTAALNDNSRAVKFNRIGMLELQAAGINTFQALAAGMSPFRVAIMEGSQVVGAFVQGTEGGLRGILALMAQMAKRAVLFLAPIAPIIGAITFELAGLKSALEKTTGKAVTFGQVMSGVWEMAKEGIASRFKPAIESIDTFWTRIWTKIAQFSVDQFNIMTRNAVQFVDQIRFAAETIETYWQAAGEAAKVVWASLPSALGSLTVSIANSVISGVQSMINGAADLIDKFIAKVNVGLSKIPRIGKNIQIGAVGHVDFGGIKNSFGSNDLAKQLSGIATSANEAVSASYKKMQDDIAKSKTTNYYTELTAEIKKAQAAAEVAKKKSGSTKEDPYDKLTRSADAYIAKQKAEAQAVGLSDVAAASLTHTQDLLNRAKQEGINLTPKQTAELKDLGAQMGAAEVATKKMKDAYNFTKDSVNGFLSSFTSAIEQGKGLWRAFGDAATSVLDKIISKIEDQLSTAITNALFNSKGGGGGFLSSIFGSIFGGGAAADPWAGLRTPGFASGTENAPAGWAWVGEKGPELRRLRSGDVIRSNARSMAMAANGNAPAAYNDNRVYQIDARGAQQGVGNEIKRALAEYDRKHLPGRVQQIQNDPRARG